MFCTNNHGQNNLEVTTLLYFYKYKTPKEEEDGTVQRAGGTAGTEVSEVGALAVPEKEGLSSIRTAFPPR